MIDIILLASKRKLGIDATENWRWATSRAVTGGFIVTGGIVKTSKAGKFVWPKKADMQTVILTKADLDFEKKQYQIETGNCYECEGTGEYCYGHSRDTGRMTRPCKYCNATGKAPIEQSEEDVL